MSVLNPELSIDWQRAVEKHLGKSVDLQQVGVVGGGSINDARRVITSAGTYFVKFNDAADYPGMFVAEAEGLRFLAAHSEFNIPAPIATGESGGIQWIMMELITGAKKSDKYWETFGRRLAKMHLDFGERFGLDQDNYLGSLHQYNEWRDTWNDFFVEKRLKPQLEMAQERKESSPEMIRQFNKLFSRIERYFPVEPPSPLHGDMWTGNFTTGIDGEAVIFDPACYFGHREMDIGMSKLFGGFDKRFYEAYNEVYPMEKGWEERIFIANLYPLMAHANLFGGGYTLQVMQYLRKYV